MARLREQALHDARTLAQVRRGARCLSAAVDRGSDVPRTAREVGRRRGAPEIAHEGTGADDLWGEVGGAARLSLGDLDCIEEPSRLIDLADQGR